MKYNFELNTDLDNMPETFVEKKDRERRKQYQDEYSKRLIVMVDKICEQENCSVIDLYMHSQPEYSNDTMNIKIWFTKKEKE